MDEHVWEELEESSKAELSKARFIPDQLQRHQAKHAVQMGMSYKEYQATAETLSEALGNVLESPIQVDKVYGYKAQNNRKYKFICVQENRADLVAYVGDDIEGTIVTFFRIPLSKLLSKLNPYIRQNRKAEDMRYKCDLDGGLRGFKAIKPDYNDENSHSPEECKEIKRRILGRIHLWKS